MSLRVKSFLLRLDYTQGRRPQPGQWNSWRRVGENSEDVGVHFKLWDPNKDLPTHSAPALEAAKCAALQGEAASWRLDRRLFEAYFSESQDISDPEVLFVLAEECGLDVPRFREDLLGGSMRPLVWSDFEEAHSYGINAIPTAVFNDYRAVVGAVPMDQYRRLVDKILAM